MGKAAREKFKLKKQTAEDGGKESTALKKQAFKKPGAAKKAIKQYLILAAILLPILLGLAFLFARIKEYIPWAENAGLYSFFIIAVYAIIIVGAWLIWLKIRTNLDKRAEKIRKAKEAQRIIVEEALEQQKREEQKKEAERQKAIKRASRVKK